MAPPSATSGSDAQTPPATTAPAPFSYAQAAKGKPSSSSSTSSSAAPVPAPPAQAKKDQARWPDDSSDTATAVEERHQTDFANSSRPKSSETTKSTSPHKPPDPTISTSHPPSPHYDSSATTTKEDDVSSPAKQLSDSIWTQKSSSQNGDRNHESSSDTARGQESLNEAATNGQPANQLMKEAPVPTVNFWTKRAEEAKAKQTQTKPAQPPPSSVSQAEPATPATAVATTVAPTFAAPLTSVGKTNAEDPVPSQPKKSKPGDQNSTVKESPESSSVPATNKPRGTKNGRAQKQETSQPKSTPLPSVRDETAWPTPLNAQDEDRRKAQDKADRDRPVSASIKPHGKNEWVHVPYTPSVKFNTPLPQTRGRGGRGGSRGGRGGSFSERGGVQASASSAKEDAAGAENRGRSDSMVGKASNQSPSDSRATSANQATVEKSSSVNGQSKRMSYQGPFHHTAQAGQNSQQPLASLSDLNGITSSVNSTARSEGQQRPKQAASASESPARRKSIAAQTENGIAGLQQPRPKRRSPSAIDQPEFVSEETPRAFSDSLPATNSSTPTEPRPTLPNRFSDGGRDSWGSLPFRDNRAERGRGRGARGSTFSMPHHGIGQHQNNSNLTPIQTNNSFTPKSGSSFQSQPYPQPGPSFSDHRSTRSGPRSASIPTDNPYQRYASTYPASAQFAVYPAYYNTVYDYNAAPMTAIPYTHHMDQTLLVQAIAFQMNYYFSLENLLKDMFLRKHMDSQGFVPLSLIANFKRMKDLTTDLDLIQYVCSQSAELELRNGDDSQPRIRKREDWDKWVLNMDERDPSAQSDGPPPRDTLSTNPNPSFNGNQSARSPYPEINQPSFDGSVGAFGMTPSFQPVPVSSPIDGSRSPRDLSARHSLPALGTDAMQAQYTSPELATNGNSDFGHEEADSFPNEQIPFLTVAVRPYTSSTPKTQPRSETSRTFSNGSISMEELKSSEDSQSKPQTSNDDHAETDPFQKILNTRKKMSTPSSQGSGKQADSVELFWFKGEESRQQPLPSNGNSELYIQLHYKALEERQHAETGNCPHDLDVLYQFWSHFLIRNFNTTMYNEFRQLAHDDAAQELSDVGLQNLITFYSEALSSQQPIRDRVASHYVSLVKNEDPSKGRPAFEQLRAAWRNGALNMKNRKRISTYVDQELRDELDK